MPVPRRQIPILIVAPFLSSSPRYSLGLIIPLPRDPTVGRKLAIPRFVGPRLGSQCARRRNRVFLGGQREVEIPRVEAHERLAGAHLLPDIDEAFDHLARNAK